MAWYVPFSRLVDRQIAMISALNRDLQKVQWLSGSAGSGKTLVMMHALERIAQDNPKATLAFITYTHALKQMVETGFSSAARGRIVIQTHTQFLKDKKEYDFVFVDEVQDIKEEELEAVNERAHTARTPPHK